MIYFGAQNDPKIVPLRPIFNTPLKVAQIDMYTTTDIRNQGKRFEKMAKDQNFNIFWGPKWPKNWVSEAHIRHTSKSTCNEHVKQYQCEASENILRKWPNTRISTYFGAQMAQKLAL